MVVLDVAESLVAVGKKSRSGMSPRLAEFSGRLGLRSPVHREEPVGVVGVAVRLALRNPEEAS